MSDAMEHRRAEELFSDDLEKLLEEPLKGELATHLRACAECRELREAVAEVVLALKGLPTPEPSPGFAGRVADTALRKRGPALVRSLARMTARSGGRGRLRSPRVPAWIQSMAAGLALMTTGMLLLTTRSEAPRRAAARIVDTTVSTGVFLAERKDRLVEDVRVLRVVIETAFEGRIEKMNERVEDYRRLLERKREPEPAPATSSGVRSNFLNRGDGRDVWVS